LPSEKVYVVKGDESNIKLTYVEDTYLLDKLFQLRTFNIDKSVENFDLTNLVFVVFGGSSGIGEALVLN
jgi:2-C-methyl-D-erythritol 4-phosphate cytidylyltransferase